MNPKNILIVGLGLIGGSVAKALKQEGYFVGAIDLNAETIEYAKKSLIIDEGSVCVEKEFVCKYDSVMFGLYPSQIVVWLEKYQSMIKDNAILSDVSGVKVKLLDDIQNILRSDLDFVAFHPMAGKEVSGVAFSDINLFRNANGIIIEHPKNKQSSIDKVFEFVSLLNFKQIVFLSAEKHDQMIGYVSQLTHAIAVSLMNANADTTLKNYTGDSFRDLTRIAKINEHLWSELFMMNKAVLIDEIDVFCEELQKLKSDLVNEDVESLKKKMVQSTKRRLEFEK